MKNPNHINVLLSKTVLISYQTKNRRKMSFRDNSSDSFYIAESTKSEDTKFKEAVFYHYTHSAMHNFSHFHDAIEKYF